MSTNSWISVAFAAALVTFLITTFFVKDRSSSTQYNTLRFLTSLCGGIAAGTLISGNALFDLSKKIGENGHIALSGTAGAAIFFTVWFFYPKREREKPADTFNFSVPDNITFENMAKTIAKESHKFVEFVNFTPAQLNLVLDSREVHTKTANDALSRLKHLNSEIPKYSVTLNQDLFTIKAN